MLLAETRKTVDQIAEETGFCDSSYFLQDFQKVREYYSVAVQKYRTGSMKLVN